MREARSTSEAAGSGRKLRHVLLALGCAATLAVQGLEASGEGPEGAAQDPLGRHVSKQYTADLEGVLERNYLRVLTSSNSFDYFIYQGRPAGYQFEMVGAFAKHLNRKYRKGRQQLKIQFELLPVESDQLIPLLLQGRGDIIAARMTITPERMDQVLFSAPYREVDELVVTNAGMGKLDGIEDLSGRSLAVRRSSSYYESLRTESARLSRAGKAPIRIETIKSLETEDILGLVAAGRFDFTVADSIVAETAVAIFPALRIVRGLELRKRGQLAWATHPTAKNLKQEMDEFLKSYAHGSLLGNVGIKKHFENYASLSTRMKTDGSVVLSAYDEHFKTYAQRFDFDWRLMAALAYQESRFRPLSRSRSGAVGLFQIKPETAREPYVSIDAIEGEKNVPNNIHAGIKYLAWIKAAYFDVEEGMRERDRVRMALAAYNAGPRTLLKAQRRAEKMGLDPLRWFRNVELALLAMNKPEPVKYVSEINRRYLSYVMLGVE